MAKTLADMTAEERTSCVGMWCDNLVSTADNPRPVVLACVQGERCWVLHTYLHGEWSCFSLGSVAPRFDLPRVWTPDGKPVLAQALVEETWEYQVQTRSQRMPTWSAITDDTLQKWYPEDKYNDLTRTGRIVRGGAGFEIRVLRRRVSPIYMAELI